MRTVVAVSIGLLSSACAGSGVVVVSASGASGELCEPGPAVSVGAKDVPGGNDRRGEALVLYLSGFDELAVTEETEGDDPDYSNSFYGGVWGDRAGGWVAAVTDCDAVDADEVAALAGGADSVRLIHVPYSFEEVDAFQDALVSEIRDSGITAEVGIDSTLTGRKVRLLFPEGEELPAGFGSSVPSEILMVEAVDWTGVGDQESDG